MGWDYHYHDRGGEGGLIGRGNEQSPQTHLKGDSGGDRV